MPEPKHLYTRIFLVLFLLFSLANLLALATSTSTDNYLTKPFLMIWLALYAVAGRPSIPRDSWKWLLIGLFFSFLGDTLLMFADGRPSGGTFFLLGLSSFLLTHVAYWVAFHRYPRPGTDVPLASYLVRIVPLVLYLLGMGYILLPALPQAMLVPVMVYSFVIVAMATKAVSLLPFLSPARATLLVAGAVLFVLSDSIIAMSRFTDLLTFSQLTIGLAIMLTYLSGQLFIVLGLMNKQPGLSVE